MRWWVLIALVSCGGPAPSCPPGFVRGPLEQCVVDEDHPPCRCVRDEAGLYDCLGGDVVFPIGACVDEVVDCADFGTPFRSGECLPE